MSKVFEKLLLKRLKPILDEFNLIPAHQFGFRNQHGTIEQVHRVADKIRNSIENKEYCSAAFLDISQAFDKVWHPGLLYKIKKTLPHQYYKILKSYLTDRFFQVKFQEEYSKLYPIEAGVPQGSVLGPTLYTLYTADLPTNETTTTATFADDTAVLATNPNPALASELLQDGLQKIEQWCQELRIKINENKSVQVKFTTRWETCPPVYLKNSELPQTEDVKYLGIHLDRRLTWKKHIQTERKQVGLKLQKMYWLLGKRSQLSQENKVLLYKAILKPIWTYGIQLWGTESTSNIEILQRFQSKILRIITDAPWYVTNETIHKDLGILTVKAEIRKTSQNYLSKLEAHPNPLAINLLDNSEVVRRLKRYDVLDLPHRHN